MDGKAQEEDLGKEPQLSIKKDAKGMVFVKGIEIAEANSAEELTELFNTGNGAACRCHEMNANFTISFDI